MAHIIWRKEYVLSHRKGFFRIYISEHLSGLFYGSVVYYNRQEDWSKGEVIDLELKVETLFSKSEEDVYQKCIQWVDKNLGNEYEIKFIEQKSIA